MLVRTNAKCFVRGVLYEPGSVFEWDGELGRHMTPVDKGNREQDRPADAKEHKGARGGRK